MGLEEKYDVILPRLAGVSGQAREHCLGRFGPLGRLLSLEADQW